MPVELHDYALAHGHIGPVKTCSNIVCSVREGLLSQCWVTGGGGQHSEVEMEDNA